MTSAVEQGWDSSQLVAPSIVGVFHPITPGLRIPSLAPRESFGLGLDRTLILGLLILRNGVMIAFVEGAGEEEGWMWEGAGDFQPQTFPLC